MPPTNGDATDVNASSGGIAADHAVDLPWKFLVGASTEDQFNTFRLPLIPIACWAVQEVRFAFDSSFVDADCSGGGPVAEDIRVELGGLKALVEKHPGCPLSLFGHADPVGSDDYNKSLSERRARAIYALLIFQSEPSTAENYWKEIAATEKWGDLQQKRMQDFVNANGGASNGSLANTYMGLLAAAGPALQKTDFLARGAGTDRKGDFQGCSEFNPLLIFSQETQTEFEQAKKDNDQDGIALRDQDNAINRRVLGLLFRKGSQVDPAKWPCPRAADGIAGCVKRFWKDGDARRGTHLPGQDRRFAATQDTFACRFYQRLAGKSPCEGPNLTLKVWLLDHKGLRMPVGSPYRLTIGGQVRTGQLSQPGLMVENRVPEVEDCTIEWGKFVADPIGDITEKDRKLLKKLGVSDTDAPAYLVGTKPEPPDTVYMYVSDVYLDINHADAHSDDGVRRRLDNMSYFAPVENMDIHEFRRDYQEAQEERSVIEIRLRDVHRDGIERPQRVIPDPGPDIPPLLCGSVEIDMLGFPQGADDEDEEDDEGRS